MANWKIDIQRVVNDIKNCSVYFPVIEWIVNSIQAIRESNTKNGKITLKIIRSIQRGWISTDPNDALEDIESFELIDNWCWFNTKNQLSFETFKSWHKERLGWKWFGRFFYLKFFERVSFKSIYEENGKKFKIEFVFDPNADEMMSDKSLTEVAYDKEVGTTLYLTKIKKRYLTSLNSKSKTIETLWRKLLEHLLIYFVDEENSCPEITISDGVEKQVLNQSIWTGKDISLIHSDLISISQNPEDIYQFKVKTFQIRYSTESNSFSLCWDNRVVTENGLWKLIPDFVHKLKDDEDNNYIIKVYVLWKYLDDCVDTERDSFNFHSKTELFETVITEKEIENAVELKIREYYKDYLEWLWKKKEDKIESYLTRSAPWYQLLKKDLDVNLIEIWISEEELNRKFHDIKHKKEQDVMILADKILKSSNYEWSEKVAELVSKIEEVCKSDLVHYVATRRVTLDIFKKSLEWVGDGNNKYELEDTVHSIIFPTKTNSQEVGYADHNLWIIDERLSFNQFVLSDQQLSWDKSRPDILKFDTPTAFRSGNEVSNPITVFEFKRPQRDNYQLWKEEDDPITQMWDYIDKIRNGKIPHTNGRPLQVSGDTPAYWFLICDLTDKIRKICEKTHSLTPSPDNQWYFWYKPAYGMYIEVMSFDKLVKNAELRNSIFFEKLKIN